MPELPEVETVRRGLRPVMEGVVIERVEQRRADLRFPLPGGFAKRLTGRRIVALNRRAKYLLGHLDDASVLLMHLGMSGRFLIIDENHPRRPNPSHNSQDNRHEHIVFHMIGGARVAYSDPRRFGMMDIVAADEFATHRLLASLGPEPLGPDFTTATLAAALAGRRTPIKAALLDQRIVAGLGNIYVNEALFRARIRPQREAATVAGAGRAGGPLSRLVDAVQGVLRDALDAGGSSLRDYAAADGSLGYFQHAFEVYGREGALCPRFSCTGTISRTAQSGRATYWCQRCQR